MPHHSTKKICATCYLRFFVLLVNSITITGKVEAFNTEQVQKNSSVCLPTTKP